MSNSVGDKIKRIREQNGLTQQEFASILGYKDKSMIAHIEKGDSDMTYEKLCLLIEKFNVDANELFNNPKNANGNQFQRLELLIGKENLEIIKTKRVAIFGLGGVGGNVCDALARSGVQNFTLIDHDKIDASNINRQLISNLNVIGQYKVDVMERHLKSINKNIRVLKEKMFYLPENSNKIDLKQFDYVVDAIDTVSAKIDIISRCHELGVPVISALGCGNKMNPTMLEVTDISKTSYDPLAKVLRRELRKRNINHLKAVYSKEQPIELKDKVFSEKGKVVPGSSAFVPPVAGIIIASEVIKDFLNKNI